MRTSIIFTILSFFLVTSCTYDKLEIQPQPIDQPIQLTPDEIHFSNKDRSDFQFYKNDPAILTAENFGAHPGFVRIKFNAKARTVLGADGKLPAGGTFPDSSVIVKEIYSSNPGPITRYAIMLKQPSNPNSAGGWVWGEYNADGSNIYSVASKGATCVSCHNNNKDYVQTFDFHP